MDYRTLELNITSAKDLRDANSKKMAVYAIVSLSGKQKIRKYFRGQKWWLQAHMEFSCEVHFGSCSLLNVNEPLPERKRKSARPTPRSGKERFSNGTQNGVCWGSVCGNNICLRCGQRLADVCWKICFLCTHFGCLVFHGVANFSFLSEFRLCSCSLYSFWCLSLSLSPVFDISFA